MKKSILILALCFVMLFAVAAVSAQDLTVTYLENDCLAEVPTDEALYAAGDEVTVLFEPVKYKDYLIFYGWDINDDGIADFGYNYNKFEMPEESVELKAICIGAYAGGSTCKGCHLHGHPSHHGFDSFTPVRVTGGRQ
jgi:hypothetical protein